MSRRWQCGDTDVVAIAFSAEPDPDGDVYAPAALAGSWGAIEVWIGGHNITQHLDRANGLHSAVHWYSAALFRWFLASCDAVRRDLAAPIPVRVDSGVDYILQGPALETMPADRANAWDERLWAWRQRHAMSSSRRGGVFPEIVFRRVSDNIEASWDPAATPSRSRARFLEPRGRHAFPVSEWDGFVNELRTSARALVGPVVSIDPDAGEIGRAEFANCLGDVLGDPRHALLFDQDGDLGPLGLVAQSLDPNLGASDARELVRLTEDVQGELKWTPHTPRRRYAWEEGYADAIALRSALGINGGPMSDVDSACEYVGAVSHEMRISDPAVESVTLYASDLGVGPVVALQNPRGGSSETGMSGVRQVAKLHALSHLLSGGSSKGRRGFAHGSDWAPLRPTQRANAFAAMALVPIDALEHVIADISWVKDVAAKYGASPEMIINHAENLRRLSTSEAEGLRHRFRI